MKLKITNGLEESIGKWCYVVRYLLHGFRKLKISRIPSTLIDMLSLLQPQVYLVMINKGSLLIFDYLEIVLQIIIIL